MKTNNKHNSLIKIIIFHFAIYSLIALCTFFILNFFTNYILSYSVPSPDDITEELENDDFLSITERQIKNCAYVVYDENDEVLYSSESELTDYLQNTDLTLVQDYDFNEFYQVFQSEENGKKYYTILLTDYDDSSDSGRILNFCKLDADYKIIDGNLFPNKTFLTDKEFELIQGSYKGKKEIVRYEYSTTDGKQRTLIFVSPRFDMGEYSRLVSAANSLWFIYIPVLLAAIAVQSFLLSRKIKKSMRPFNDAIVSYGSGKRLDMSELNIPREFQPVIENFDNLSDLLDRAKAEKEHEEQEKYRMIANVSHDLKTPLTVIQGYAKAFCDGMVLPEKEEAYMETIYQKAKSSSELMDTLFEYTKLEHPDYILNFETVDLAEFIREYLSDKYSEIEFHGFLLDLDIPERTVLCSIDKAMMSRVLENLTENALKYNKSGTTLFFSLKEEKESLKLTIADNGIGITDSIKHNLFDPFVTGNAARTSGGGTGLGMAIIKKVIELHQGAIKLIDPPHEGKSTEIEITLEKI